MTSKASELWRRLHLEAEDNEREKQEVRDLRDWLIDVNHRVRAVTLEMEITGRRNDLEQPVDPGDK